jgi:biopolymer transport protein TolR
MAMSLASRKNGGRRSRRARTAPLSEINVTPLVDVMLVLLIVFMVAAPLLTVGVPIDLPQTAAKTLDTEAKPITISITPQGEIYLGEDLVQLADLTARVDAVAVNGAEDRLYVRGAAEANYGTVMQVMGALSGAGYAKIGLITEKAQGL